ncbi:MAG: hypothetical protein RLZZ262_985 [Bacteroidota bacterium]|jgi:hypothetical protein
MSGIFRLIIRICIVVVLALLVVAFFTNPNEEDFKNEVKNQLKSQFADDPDNAAAQFLSDTTSDFTETAIDKFLVRKNYFVCSVYEIHLPFGEYKFLGAYNNFLPLQSDNPLDKLAK